MYCQLPYHDPKLHLQNAKGSEAFLKKTSPLKSQELGTHIYTFMMSFWNGIADSREVDLASHWVALSSAPATGRDIDKANM